MNCLSEQDEKGKKLKKIKSSKSLFSDIDRWSDNEHPPSILSLTPGTPQDDQYMSKSPIRNILFEKKKSIEDTDLKNTFGVVADTLEELDDIPNPTSPERPEKEDTPTKAENEELKQKERAEYLLKQYYLFREKNEVLKRLEKRTKLMYERVRLKKTMIEQQKQEQIERCLSVFQLLSKTHPEEANILEKQHLQHLKEEYDCADREKNNQNSEVNLSNEQVHDCTSYSLNITVCV